MKVNQLDHQAFCRRLFLLLFLLRLFGQPAKCHGVGFLRLMLTHRYWRLLDLRATLKENILRLQVHVDDIFAVHIADSTNDLSDDFSGIILVHQVISFNLLLDRDKEVTAIAELTDDVVVQSVLENLTEAHDCWMIYMNQEQYLGHELFFRFRIHLALVEDADSAH